MKLYYHPLSSNARKAVMTAELLGSPVEKVLVNLPAGEQYSPAYVGLNPNAKVPLLVDGELVLWESMAIMMYLADKAEEQALYPSELTSRADVNRWLFWAAAHWTPTIGILNFENMLKKILGRGETDQAVVERTNVEMIRLAKILDSHLATRPFMSGETLTLADVAIACPMMTLVPAKLPLQPFENLLGWFGRIQQLDAWKKSEN